MSEEQEKYIRKMRLENRNCLYWQMVCYVGSAVFAAAAFSDLESAKQAGSLENFGLMLILLRLTYLAPMIHARIQKKEKWMEAEYEYVVSRYPWALWIGRAGVWMLVLSMGMQIILGMR